MEKNIYLFRHGETNYNLRRLRQGCGINAGLNTTGQKQAEALAQSLKDKGIEVIYSSPLQRALETSQIVSLAVHAPVIITEAFTEGNFGDAEGLHEDEVKARWPEIISGWYVKDFEMDTGFPGGETKAQIQKRMFNALNSLLETPEKTIAVSSHSAALRFLLMKIGGGTNKIPNAQAILVRFADGIWKIC